MMPELDERLSFISLHSLVHQLPSSSSVWPVLPIHPSRPSPGPVGVVWCIGCSLFHYYLSFHLFTYIILCAHADVARKRRKRSLSRFAAFQYARTDIAPPLMMPRHAFYALFCFILRFIFIIFASAFMARRYVFDAHATSMRAANMP